MYEQHHLRVGSVGNEWSRKRKKVLRRIVAWVRSLSVVLGSRAGFSYGVCPGWVQGWIPRQVECKRLIREIPMKVEQKSEQAGKVFRPGYKSQFL